MWKSASPIVIRRNPGQSATAHAFTPNVPPGTWASAALPVPFVLGGSTGRDIGTEAAAELDVAIRAWTFAPCSAWSARFDGSQSRGAADDGINMVLFHDDAWPASLEPLAVAQTVVHVDQTGHYRDADIHLNSFDFRFSLSGAAGTIDLRSVLVHELGHALGLGHSADPSATMFASGSGVRWRSLEGDDRVGLCALYPGTSAVGADCAIVPCPKPFLCVAKRCQRPSETADVCSPCTRLPGACEGAGDDARCITQDNGGLVCGRSCRTDGECGAGFHCKATSEAGDLQCVSDSLCRNGANTCQANASCGDASVTCRDGACTGTDEARDAGPPAPRLDAGDSGDASTSSAPVRAQGGCDCRLRSDHHAPSGIVDGDVLMPLLACAVVGLRRALSVRSRARVLWPRQTLRQSTRERAKR